MNAGDVIADAMRSCRHIDTNDVASPVQKVLAALTAAGFHVVREGQAVFEGVVYDMDLGYTGRLFADGGFNIEGDFTPVAKALKKETP